MRATRSLIVRAAVLVGLAGLLGTAPAGAAVPGPAWRVESFAMPTNFLPGGEGTYTVTARNVGSVATDGTPVMLRDTLPAGLSVQQVQGGSCTTVPVSCEYGAGTTVEPDGTLTMEVRVKVEAGAAASLVTRASVLGGGAPQASVEERNGVSASPAPFGASSFGIGIDGADGGVDSQAGDHPYELLTSIALDNAFRAVAPQDPGKVVSVQDPKDTVVDLPLGFMGSALAAPRCTLAQISSYSRCPANTVVGHLKTEGGGALTNIDGPLYNMVPEKGYAAEFGYYDFPLFAHVLYARVVSSPSGYVLQTSALDLPQVPLTRLIATFYGDPSARDGDTSVPTASFTNPSSCSGEPLTSRLLMDSWQNPGSFNPDGTPDLAGGGWVEATSSSPPVTGCNMLQFSPGLSVQPETSVADSPTGLNVDIAVPQSELPGTLATPPLRDTTLTLPAGVALNPAAANGLTSCSLAQIALGSSLPPSCPDTSKVGTVELQTPLLPGTLDGSIYEAAQEENPFDALAAVYIVIDDPATGVVIKIPGRLDLDGNTGQITSTFDDAPQFPFSDLKVHFFGGQRGVLATPQSCGAYNSSGVLSPWSAPDSGPAAELSDGFPIASGCAGTFSPAFQAGSTDTRAGGFTSFTTTLSRGDEDQDLGGVSIATPPGLLGLLKSVQLCGEPQASQGTCGAGSLIGHTTVGAGAGPDPFYATGQVFLTGPYKGAPFGLSIVVPAVAGPFNLGNIVVRARIDVDPHTARLTVTSDPLPHILRGIPLDVRVVNVTVDRSGFMFNPTDCEPLAVDGAITSTQGAQEQVSSRFQASDCQGMAFRPSFKATTRAGTSKKNGASLDVTVGPAQGQANIAKAAVTLPKQLPARLSTIQQACPEATFAANPASCPAGSDIGTAVARTPVLANPLAGPAYLVSHGGAAFPDVDVVLQGEGLTLDLTGGVNIRHGVTSSAFDGVPDAPISSFELSLPEGPHSGLAAVIPAKAKGSLCGASLVMPTTLTGQNGAVVKQNTKIAVTGCTKAKPKKKKAKAKKRKRKG